MLPRPRCKQPTSNRTGRTGKPIAGRRTGQRVAHLDNAPTEVAHSKPHSPKNLPVQDIMPASLGFCLASSPQPIRAPRSDKRGSRLKDPLNRALLGGSDRIGASHTSQRAPRYRRRSSREYVNSNRSSSMFCHISELCLPYVLPCWTGYWACRVLRPAQPVALCRRWQCYTVELRVELGKRHPPCTDSQSVDNSTRTVQQKYKNSTIVRQ